MVRLVDDLREEQGIGMKNVAQLFVDCLENEGVQFIFGVPGEENVEFMMALEESPIQFILCRHEQGAAFMADVYGRLTGEVGVCLGTLGPGATNLVTGVADANMDMAPLVVITGQAESIRQHKESHQNMDVVGMFKPITKWAQSICNGDNTPEVVRKAFKIAREEKPGACHIELANDIAEQAVSGEPLKVVKPRRPVPDDKIIDLALETLCSASRPIILAGNGAVRKKVSKQLRTFCNRTGIGVVSTFMGKGAVSRLDPTCLFTIGMQSRDFTWDMVNESDLVITLGYDLVEYPPSIWNQCDTGNKKIIHIDYLPAETDSSYPVDVEIVGDLSHALWMLNQRVENKGSFDFDLGYQHKLRQQMVDDFEQYKDDDQRDRIRPQKILWDVRQVMGPGDILLSDVGAHKMWVARYYHCEEPNTCMISNGFCSMGFALPGAVGAKLAYPEKNVVAVCGDGGFLMNVQELETARRLGANIIVLIWEDNEYGLIKWKQQNQFGTHTDLYFNNPDFVALAQAFDCVGIRVSNSDDLKPALEKAFDCDKPVLLSIPVDYRENRLLTKRLGRIQCTI